MDFNELLNDIAKLEGLHLSSIRPGADIIVEKVDVEQEKIIVQNSSGKVFSRSVVEFRRIWDALLSEPAIRVEEVLNGSGSSRNQPETIFANLPYIEWLKINNKKHIAFVDKSTHPFGTLKKMDDLSADKIKDDKTNSQTSEIVGIISAVDIYKTASFISSLSGAPPIPERNGVYLFPAGDKSIAVIDSITSGVPEGTYGLFSNSIIHVEHADYQITINGDCFGIVKRGCISVFFLQKERK